MKLDMRWKVFLTLGCGAFALGLYTAWKTWVYFTSSADMGGAAIFGCAALALFLVSGLHGYMAFGFKVGRLDMVSGSISAATLHLGQQIVAKEAPIRFIRRLDADNASLPSDQRYVFFICRFRPWVCKEKDFQLG